MSASASQDGGWHRHFEGWQLGAIAGSIALGAVALALPRAVAPRELPLPPIDRSDERRAERADADRVARAEATPLPYLVRAAGDALRRFGVVETSRDAAAIDAAQVEFAEQVDTARRRHGNEAILTLRAVQASLFVRAVSASGAAPNREVIELGGDFPERAKENGWVDARGRVLLDEDETACLFRMRWDKLAGLLEMYPFSPSLNEWRLYYRTLLEHGVGSSKGASPSATIAGLVKVDPEYPELLARGIVAYWDGRYADATELLSQHLAKHPVGPWRLRAQNYLLAAYARAPK